MKKLSRLIQELNEDFKFHLADQMRSRFGIEVETTLNLAGMTLVTTRTDGQDFTPEQMEHLAGYSEGYGQVFSIISQAAGR